MSYTLVNIAQYSQNSGGSGTLTTSPFNISAGQVIYAVCADASGAGPTSAIQDASFTNFNYTALGGGIGSPSPNPTVFGNFLYYPTAQTGMTLTYTSTLGDGFCFSLFSITGSNGTEDSLFNNYISNQTGTAPSVAGGHTPAVSGELVIAMVVWQGTATFTALSGWPSFTSTNFVGPSSIKYSIAGGTFTNSGSSNVTYNSGATNLLSASSNFAMTIDAFEPSAGGVLLPVPNRRLVYRRRFI